jgi:Fic family protein
VMAGRGDLLEVGAYRTSAEPMQVVSGADYARRVHFEAPPSPRVPAEMERFVAWFNRTAPRGATPLPALTRAGIAHLYFESVHPFADGNGRIGRAIAEKALIQSFGETVIVGLATAILANRGAYYKALEAANKRNEVSAWLAWFAAVTLQAQLRTTARVEFLIEKTRFIDRVFSGCNERQRKVLLRMLAEGPEGFKGGLSAAKYSTISGASSATATRDLGALVTLGALTREGERKHTRYALALPVKPIPRITIAPDGSIAAA